LDKMVYMCLIKVMGLDLTGVVCVCVCVCEGLQRVQNAGTHTAQFVCETCHQEFWKSQDIVRHKCNTTRPQGKKS